MNLIFRLLSFCFCFTVFNQSYADIRLDQLSSSPPWQNPVLVICSDGGDEVSTMFKSMKILDHWRSFYEQDIVFVHILFLISKLAKCDLVTNTMVLLDENGVAKKTWSKVAPSLGELLTVIDAEPTNTKEIK